METKEKILLNTTRCTITEEAEDINENYYFQWNDVLRAMEEYAQFYHASQKAEVPSDEEIQKKALATPCEDDDFIRGAKWMRDNFTPSSESDKLKEAIKLLMTAITELYPTIHTEIEGQFKLYNAYQSCMSILNSQSAPEEKKECQLCHGNGEYTIGGSFGGNTQVIQCKCGAKPKLPYEKH